MSFKQNYLKQQDATRGFSLIEVMVYLAVTVLVSLAGINTYLSLDTVLLRNATERALTHSASVSLERMVRDIRGAESVNLGLSTLDASPGVLTLDQAGTTTSFSIVDGKLNVSVNGTSHGPLTSNSVTVESLVFNKYSNAQTDLVRVSLTLSIHSKAASSTKTFYTSAVLRGTYE